MCTNLSDDEPVAPFSRNMFARIDACVTAGTAEACQQRNRVLRKPDGTRRAFCPLNVWAVALVDAGVAVKHRDLIVADRLRTRPLEQDEAKAECIPLLAAQAFTSHQPRTLMHDTDRASKLTVTGEETLLCLCGTRGIGKSLAAAYIVAYLGGRVVDAYPFARPGVDVDSLVEQRGVVVIDQLGREYAKSDWSVVQIEEVVERRRKLGKLTVLCANLNRKDFVRRYQEFIEDRLNEDCAFVLAYGQSRRGAQ